MLEDLAFPASLARSLGSEIVKAELKRNCVHDFKEIFVMPTWLVFCNFIGKVVASTLPRHNINRLVKPAVIISPFICRRHQDIRHNSSLTDAHSRPSLPSLAP